MEQAAEWLRAAGPLALAVITLLATMGIPVPATPGVVVAGAFAARGGESVVALFAAALIGAAIGDGLSFGIGRRGEEAVHSRLEKRRLWRRARRWVEAHAGWTILLGRFPISWLQFPTALLSGAARGPYLRFLAWALPGQAMWVAAYMALGYYGWDLARTWFGG